MRAQLSEACVVTGHAAKCQKWEGADPPAPRLPVAARPLVQHTVLEAERAPWPQGLRCHGRRGIGARSWRS